MSKLDLEIGKGVGFNDSNTYSVSLNIKNYDTSSVPLSAVRVSGYFWNQQRTYEAFTSAVDSNGSFSVITSSDLPNYNGVGQYGIVDINLTDYVYRIDHGAIDSSTVSPVISLIVPNGQSYIAPISISKRTDNYFEVSLTEVPPTVGYKISWYIPVYDETYSTVTAVTATPHLHFSNLEVPFLRSLSKKADSKFVISWPTSNESIALNYGLIGTSLRFFINNGFTFFNSNLITNWYSEPEFSEASDSPFFVLEQYVDGNWTVVQEYNSSSELDTSTGSIPNTQNHLVISGSSMTADTYSVSICEGSSNPVGTIYENTIRLKTDYGNSRCRGLVKFDISSIPSSATDIDRALLRLCVNSVSGATNYSLSDGTIAVHRVTNNWNRTQATWDLKSTGVSWDTPGGDFTSEKAVWIGNSNIQNTFTSSVSQDQFYVDFDITSFVRHWRLYPAENFGLVVKLTPQTHEDSTNTEIWDMNGVGYTLAGIRNGLPTLNVFYRSPNVSGPIPSVVILNDNTTSYGSYIVSASAGIAGGFVSEMQVLSRDPQLAIAAEVVGIMTSNEFGIWTATISGTPGTAEIFVRAISDLGIFGESEKLLVTFVNAPEFQFTTSGDICFTNSVQINGNFVAPTNAVFTDFRLRNAMIPKEAVISDIIQDTSDANVVWVGTWEYGLWRFDTVTELWTKFDTSNSNIPTNSIFRMRMESNGLLWATLIDSYQNGRGVVRFNTLNWATQNSNDWYWFNNTNSPLSAFSQNGQRIDGLDIDSNNVKWFGLTWESNNNVFAVSGSIFNTANTTVYNTGYPVRSIKATPAVTYIGTTQSSIISITSAGVVTDNYTDSLVNHRHIDVDASGRIWVASIYGIGEFSPDFTQSNIVSFDQTPEWPNGLNSSESPLHKLKNTYCVTLFIDSDNTKWFGFAEQDYGTVLYNGGLVKYTGATFQLSATSAASNWQVYDKDNAPGFPNNNVSRIIRDASGKMYLGTWGGFCFLDNGVWRQYNKEQLIFSHSTSGLNHSVEWTNPSHRFEDTEFVFDIDGYEITYPVSLNLSKTPTLNIVLPQNRITSVVPNTVARAAYFSINADFAGGDDITTTVLRSDDNLNWITHTTSSSNYAEAFYNFQESQKVYFKATSTTQLGCSAESSSVLVFGGVAPTSTISATSIDYSTANPLYISGVCYDVDTLDPKMIDGFIYTKSIIGTLIADKGTTSAINIAVLENGIWQYTWYQPTIGTSAIDLILEDSDGHTFETTFILPSAIVSAPTVNMVNPPYSGLVVHRHEPIVLSATAFSESPTQFNLGINSVKFFAIADDISREIGNGSYVGTTWELSGSVSAISNLFNTEYSSYGIFASAVDNDGKMDISEVATLTINTPPTFTVLAPVGNACSISPSYLTADVTRNRIGISAAVQLISGTNVVYSSASDFNGQFSWQIPSFGAYSLSAKTFDSNFPGDYSLTDISFNLGITPSATNEAFLHPFAIEKDGTISTEKYIVSAGLVLVSAAFTNATSVVYYSADFINGAWKKGTYLNESSNAGNRFSVLIDIPAGQQKAIYVEASSSPYCSSSKVLIFYGIDLDAEISLGSLCNASTVINGRFSIDEFGPNANPYISNSVSATLKANGTSAIGTPSLNWSSVGSYLFSYDWNSPIPGTSSIDLTVYVDASPSATFSYSLPIDSLVIQTSANVNTGIKDLSATKPNIYVNQFDGAVLSASTNAQNVSKVEYLIETKDSVYISTGSQVAPYTAAISTPRGIINYRAKITTTEGCEFFSEFTSILTKISPLVDLTINSNYCSDSFVEFVGSVKTVKFTYSDAYDISASGYSIKNDNAVIRVRDSFGTTVFTSATSAFGNESEFGLYYILTSPSVGTSAFVSNYTNEIFNIDVKQIVPTVRLSESVGISSPISGSTHNILSGIVLSISGTNPSNPITFIDYFVDGVTVKRQDISGTGNYAFNWIPVSYGTKTVKSVSTFANGCVVESSAVPFNVIDSSVAFIVSPINGTSLISGTSVEFVAAVNSVTNGDISAVTLISDLGTSATMIQRSSSLWSTDVSITNATSAYFVKAAGAYGSFQSPVNVYGIIEPLITSISVNSNTASVSAEFSLTATTTTPNGAIISASVFEVVNTVYNYLGELTLSGSDYVFTLPANRIDIGVNDIVVRFVDEYNVSSESRIELTVLDVVLNTYPNITYLSSDPETRMAEYGTIIESRFLMQDNLYGIDTSTISFNSPYATLQSITPINGNYKLEVLVAISGTANLIVSAANNIGNYSSATVANYIFVCEGSRQINLTNYIPNDASYDFERGSNSEFYTLTKFFETYLNTLYEHLEKPCSIGILDKISKLRSLHDIDTIDISHIQYFANLMGYNVNVNLGEIGLFSQPEDVSQFVDNENFVGQLSEYQQKALRFVIRNLPNWYSIKTTRNAIRMLLLSFGIFGDIVEMYTTDYVSDWVQNIPTRDQIIDDTISPNYWPTPHMAVYLDLNSTDRSAIYGDSSMLTALYNSINSIRPANTVFEGLVGKYDTELPPVYVDMTVHSEETIYVPEANRLG